MLIRNTAAVLLKIVKQFIAFFIGAISVFIASYISLYLISDFIHKFVPSGSELLKLPIILLLEAGALYIAFILRTFFQTAQKHPTAWKAGYFSTITLVVIGILLVSFSSPGKRPGDAAIKSNLVNAQAQAEQFYDNNGGSYLDLCESSAEFLKIKRNIEAIVDGTVNCFDSPEGYAIETPLKSENGDFFCVDSSGNRTVHDGSTISRDDLVCGY